MKFALGLVAAAFLSAGIAQAQTAPEQALEWTPVNAFNGEYHLSLPCTKDEITAWRKSANPELAANGGGCSKSGYTAVGIVIRNVRPNFFEYLVSTSQGNRLPPEQIGGRRTLRTLDAPKNGSGEVIAQFVELDKSRFVVLTFESKPTGTAQSRAIADRFLNSLEFAK